MIISFLIVSFNIIFSNIIFVPDDYDLIQNAINSSTQNDTIYINTGTYNENLIIDNKSLFIASTSGPDSTIIDGGSSGPVLVYNNVQNENSILSGFTIQNGIGENINGSSFGGGILSKNSFLILDNLIIANNSAFAGGGVCFFSESSTNNHPLIKNSIITNNYASEGGGIFSVNHILEIENTIIEENGMDLYGSGGGIQLLLGELHLENVLIKNNETKFGGGIYISNSTANFNNSNITGNYSDSKGGGIWVGGGTGLQLFKTIISNNQSIGFGGGIFVSNSNINIINSNIVNNFVDSNVLGAGIYMDGGDAIVENSIIYFNRLQGSNDSNYNLSGYSGNLLYEFDTSYSNIETNNSTILNDTGNISTDPLFADNIENPYFLQYESPCIDAGNPIYYDSDGTIIDMGAFFFNQSSSGDINLDGEINVQDVVILVNSILYGYENNEQHLLDINQDENINIQDVIILVSYIFN